jgi:hypothetical protein
LEDTWVTKTCAKRVHFCVYDQNPQVSPQNPLGGRDADGNSQQVVHHNRLSDDLWNAQDACHIDFCSSKSRLLFGIF